MALRGLAAMSGTMVKPSIWGKLKASIQFLAILLAILRLPEPWGRLYLDEWVMWLAAIVTIASGWQYVASFWSVVRRSTPGRRGGRRTRPCDRRHRCGGGAPILRLLVESGRRVGALVRSAGSAESVEMAGATAVNGDLLNHGSLVRAFTGFDVVYHVAGVNQFCVSDPEPMDTANVDGSRNVLRACAAAGVRRLVYTSLLRPSGRRRGRWATRARRTGDISSPNMRGRSTWPSRRSSPSGPRSRWWRSTRPPQGPGEPVAQGSSSSR